MVSLSRSRQRLPVAVRAILTGLLVVIFGALGWFVLLAAANRLTASIPWATGPAFVIAGALYLWGFWRYVGGAGWPRSTREPRQRNLRARKLSGALWIWALSAGASAILGYIAFIFVWERVVGLQPWITFSNVHLSWANALCILLATAAEAGIVEEAAFRGYMQAPLEKRYGPVIAIAITSAVFGAIHILNGSFELSWLFLYAVLGAILGILAYITNSILPGVVLHAASDALRFIIAMRFGPNRPKPLIWQSGTDAAFWLRVAAVVVFGAIAVWAYRKLSAMTRAESAPRLT